MGKLTRVLEKSGYDVTLEAFQEPATEVEFSLAKDQEHGAGAGDGAGVKVVYRDRYRDPIISHEWDDRLRRLVNNYRNSAKSFRQLRSKMFLRNK